MGGNSEIHRKEAEVVGLCQGAARIVAAASAQSRELTKEEDTHVLALLNQVRLLDEEVHRRTKHRGAS